MNNRLHRSGLDPYLPLLCCRRRLLQLCPRAQRRRFVDKVDGELEDVGIEGAGIERTACEFEPGIVRQGIVVCECRATKDISVSVPSVRELAVCLSVITDSVLVCACSV